MRSRPRILAIGYGVKPTGFARVLESVMGHLHDQFDFHHFAMNWTGEPPPRPWTVHPNRIEGDPFGRLQVPALLDELRPDLVFLNHDFWLYLVHREALERVRPHTKTILYCPIDGVLARPRDLSGLEGIDCLVAYTHFGAGQLRRAFTPSELSGAGAPAAPPMRIIPHGIDTRVFHPIADDLSRAVPDHGRRRARQALFPDRPELDRAFLVLNANRHNYRKRLDITVEGFALFARGKPAGVKLYLHAPIHVADPVLQRTYDRLRGEDRILHTPAAGARFPSVSDETLNLIYNACDVGLNTASGEGWGLVSFEHAATGAAQIVPSHTSCAELWAGSGLLVEAVKRECPPGDYIEHHVVSPQGVAAALEFLYTHRRDLARRSRSAYERATQAQYRWDHVARQWSHLFQDVLSDRVHGDRGHAVPRSGQAGAQVEAAPAIGSRRTGSREVADAVVDRPGRRRTGGDQRVVDGDERARAHDTRCTPNRRPPAQDRTDSP